MERRRLGKSDLSVPILSFGAMVFGDQNTEDEGHRLLDALLDRGIDLIDIAELYPTPPKRETQGASERVVGTWLAKRKRRDDVIITSKVVGPSPMTWFRTPEANPDLTYKEVVEACERSLKRLNTDYIDLYQLHWPSRSVSVWGANPVVFKHGDREGVSILETLRALDDLVKAGKVRHIGLSNESAWGVMRFLRLSEDHKLARIQSVQNGYSLVNRTYETALAEISMIEGISLLAYSPLAQGILTGKYRGGARPPGARRTLSNRMQRYEGPGAEPAFEAYFKLAEKHGLDPGQMALKFAATRPFMGSVIMGVTTLAQLDQNVAALDITLSDEVLAAIDDIQRLHANPCP